MSCADATRRQEPAGGLGRQRSLSPQAQGEYSKLIAYGPTNLKALSGLDPKVLAGLPTAPANAKDALQFNFKFWADQGEELDKRFASWAAK